MKKISLPLVLSLIPLASLSAQHILPETDNDWSESNQYIYLTDEVTSVYVTMNESDLDAHIADPYTDIYVPCEVRFVNSVMDETITNVGIRPRGNSQRDAKKFPWKLSFNEFVIGRQFHGVEKMNFAGESTDPSMSRESLAYEVMRSMGVAAPRTAHLWLTINDGTKVSGVYNNIEQVDEEFVQAWFNNKDGDLYKCRWKGDGAKLNWVAPGDAAAYEALPDYEEKITGNYQPLADFINFIVNSDTQTFRDDISSWMNVDSFLRAQAVDMYLGQWDGLWILPNNYYLYWDTTSALFEYVPWDLDHSMGMDYWVFPYFFGTDWATRDFDDWGLNSVAAEPGQNGPPLIHRLLAVPTYESKLAGYLQDLAADHGHPRRLTDSITNHFNQLQPIAFTGAFSGNTTDNNYTAQDFVASWTSPSTYSGFSTPATWGIIPFLENRSAYVRDFYPSLSSQLTIPISINEAVAKNTNGISDEFGEFEDWIEIYNSSSQPIDLGGYFLSDRYSNSSMWEFPSGTMIQAKDYLIVWCDTDVAQGPLHTNFKLDKDGSGIYLFAPASSLNYLVNSMTYSELSNDQSIARIPDASQNIVLLDNPTPLAFNETGDLYLCKIGFVPDPMALHCTGLTANSQAAYLWSYNFGAAVIGGNQCSGVTLGLMNPFHLGALTTADAYGLSTVQVPQDRVPAGICAQVIDVATCATSNVIQF